MEYGDKKIEVTGLEVPGTFDPFEGVTVEFSNRSGDGYATMDYPYDSMYAYLNYNGITKNLKKK